MESKPGRAGNLVTGALVLRARAGDREAYDRLFALTADRVLLYVRMRLGEGLRRELESMDVLQEAYAEALRSLGDFDRGDDGAFARWLCRIAENRIRDLADRHGAAKRRPPGGVRPVTEVLDRVRASGTGPVTCAARAEKRACLERAVGALGDEERQAILLRYFQDRTVEEMGEVMGKSPSAVRRLLGRAIARLGDELKAREATSGV